MQAGYRNAEFFTVLIRNLYAAERTAKERADAKSTETALFTERNRRKMSSDLWRSDVKNWLFAGNEAGGKHLAVLTSFSATCKKNNVHFRAWLEDILLKLGSTPSTQIDSLLPHLWNGAD